MVRIGTGSFFLGIGSVPDLLICGPFEDPATSDLILVGILMRSERTVVDKGLLSTAPEVGQDQR